MIPWFYPHKGQHPNDGDTVLIWFEADDVLGPEAWFVAEYHYDPTQKRELNRHNWHAPDDPRNDYATPDGWQCLTRPLALRTAIHEYSFAPGIRFEVSV